MKRLPLTRQVFPPAGTRRGRLRLTIPQPSSPSTVLSLPDGRILSAAGNGLLLYDKTSGLPLGELGSHQEMIVHAALSSDGTLLASSSKDGELRFFRPDGSCVARRALPQPGGRERLHISRLAAIPNSDLFVGATEPTGSPLESELSSLPLGLWVFDTAGFSFLPVGHTKDVTAVAVTPDGERIVSGSEDGTIRVWNRRTNSLERVMQMSDERWGYGSRVGALVITRDGRRVISASSWSGPIKIWDLASGEQVGALGHEGHYSVAMALSADGKRLFVGGHFQVRESLGGIHASVNRTISVWSLPAGDLKEVLSGHQQSITCLALTGDGGSLLSASSDDSLRVWDLQSAPARRRSAEIQFGEISMAKVHPTGKWLTVGDWGKAATFDIHTGKRRKAVCRPSYEDLEIEGACATADGRRVLFAVSAESGEDAEDSVGKTTTLEVYDLRSGKRVERVYQHTQEVDPTIGFFQGLHVTADGRLAVTVGTCFGSVYGEGGFVNQGVVAWSLKTGRIVRALRVATPHHGKPYAEEWPSGVSRDGRYFAFATPEDEFRLCDLQDNFRLKTFGHHEGWIGGVTFLTGVGQVVTAGGHDEAIRAWSLADGKKIWEWERQGHITAIAASPSERYLVVGTRDRQLRVLEVGSGAEVASSSLDAPVSAFDLPAGHPWIAFGDTTGGAHVFAVENCPDW